MPKSTGNRPGPEAASGLMEAGKVWGRGRDRTPRWGLAAASQRARLPQRPPLPVKLAAFTSVGRKNDETSLKGYCEGGIASGLRL